MNKSGGASMIEPNPKTDTYIGDGVYVRYAGGGVWLYTQDGYAKPRALHAIYLEPEVYCNLTQFMGRSGNAGGSV